MLIITDTKNINTLPCCAKKTLTGETLHLHSGAGALYWYSGSVDVVQWRHMATHILCFSFTLPPVPAVGWAPWVFLSPLPHGEFLLGLLGSWQVPPPLTTHLLAQGSDQVGNIPVSSLTWRSSPFSVSAFCKTPHFCSENE